MISLNYFASTTLAPLFNVFEVYNDVNHPSHSDLIKDIEQITQEQIDWFSSFSELRFHIDENKDSESQKRLYIFLENLEKEIYKLRVSHLISYNGLRPLPYSHPTLQNIKLDNNYLVNFDDLNFISGGFAKEHEVFILLPTTNVTNSSYWLLQALLGIERTDIIKIRLDPLIHEPEEKFNPMMFKMQVYGKSLDWDRIKKLNSIEHTEFLPEFPSSRDILKTDVVWKPNDDEIHFTCEEMPKKEVIEFRGSRYFHAIFEKGTGLIKHCDGAIRFYSEEEYDKRIKDHIKSNVVTRIGKRIKIFQIDVPKKEMRSEIIEHQNLIELIASFYVWNNDVLSYFN